MLTADANRGSAFPLAASREAMLIGVLSFGAVEWTAVFRHELGGLLKGIDGLFFCWDAVASDGFCVDMDRYRG